MSQLRWRAALTAAMILILLQVPCSAHEGCWIRKSITTSNHSQTDVYNKEYVCENGYCITYMVDNCEITICFLATDVQKEQCHCDWSDGAGSGTYIACDTYGFCTERVRGGGTKVWYECSPPCPTLTEYSDDMNDDIENWMAGGWVDLRTVQFYCNCDFDRCDVIATP